ncbi:MAG: hypothetical protein ACREJM_07440, partial [Candidatus Saccharimonadales bacterium]
MRWFPHRFGVLQMTKSFSEKQTPSDGSVQASRIKLQQRAAERAVVIARLISENDCNNRFCTFWSASMLLTVGLNVTSFFDEERQANPAWYSEMSRLLEAE